MYSRLDQSGDLIKVQNVKTNAMKLLEEGSYETAVRLLEDGVKANITSAENILPLLQLLMTAQRHLGRHLDVITTAQKIVEIDNNNFRAILSRASAFLNLVNCFHSLIIYYLII